ncbi:hypothetical protein MKAN_07740 [Mycobacterium kansasii ATCC 12478]|uniref:Uncharacterized protein n=1 Tax=Mycobacterium kansasii ATCC 12478 TaxID=557599 RepID=U5WYB7_MYCKA|nr:hypothetical protein MKAN_07740 [Mycobacterium kansasii ATCC 12478]
MDFKYRSRDGTDSESPNIGHAGQFTLDVQRKFDVLN